MWRLLRFPPEPNGFLHLGHAKAMLADFDETFAMSRCILRFDDTNPETESQDYVNAILRDVVWMGCVPCKITFTSDYFQQLWNFAEQLINQGDAYICHQTPEERSQTRRLLQLSPWRERPIQESLDLFKQLNHKMCKDTVLRLKTPDKADPVAYRQKECPHFKTGIAWKAYPTYDMSHCIVDSLEGITMSLCTREFYDKRETYFWLLDILKLKKPDVYEFARLNLPDGLTSKRKIKKLIEDKVVDDWDDPRLLTLSGLRRRGVPSDAIRKFCNFLGLTTRESSIPFHNLFHHVRDVLNKSCPRIMAVTDPLRVVISNLSEPMLVQAKQYPNQKERDSDTYDVMLTKQIFIDRSDFQLEASSKYYGLTPGRTVMLKYAGVIRYTSHEITDNVISSVNVEFIPDYQEKTPKGVLTWVASEDSVTFTTLNLPESADTLTTSTVGNLTGPRRLTELYKSSQPFQVERSGYFIADSKSDRLIMTCPLRSNFR